MDDSEDVSIDMEKLADTLSGKLETLHHLSKDCSIYRVAEHTRCSNPSHFTPRMVSIGPFHHGKEELKAMDEHKQRYLNCFLQRTKVRMARFLSFIKERETKLRNCYAETIRNLGSDEFVAMVLVDAVFLVEFFLRFYKCNLITDDDRIFRKPRLCGGIWHDFLLVENQLPLFILNDLFNLAKTATYEDAIYENISFVKITCFWFRSQVLVFLPLDENSLETHFSKSEHFLDLIMLCLQPSQSRAQIVLKDQNIPSARELHQAGVKFKPAAGSTKNLLDINFNRGILEIPFFKVYDNTESVYRNLLAFESMHGYNGYFNDYIIMMACLISCPKDAELLVQNEVIRLGNTETVPTVFENLYCTLYKYNFQYAGVVTDLQAYRKLPWHRWKATLKQNYFNTPWASISVAAAVILLLLTATQTVSSLIAS